MYLISIFCVVPRLMKTVVESGETSVIGSKIVSVVSFLQEEIAKATGYSKSTVIKFLKTAENFGYDVTDKLAQNYDIKQAISEVIAYWHGLGIDAQFAKENGLEGLSYLQGSIKLNT